MSEFEKNLLWFRQVLGQLNVSKDEGTSVLYNKNPASKSVENTQSKLSKHIFIRNGFSKEIIRSKRVGVKYVKSEKIYIAGIFIKPLGIASYLK